MRFITFLLFIITTTFSLQIESNSNSNEEPVGYFEKLGNAFWGFLFGIILFFFSSILLWFVEKSAAEYELIGRRCKRAVVKIDDASVINPAFEGRPVFLTGHTLASSFDKPSRRDSATGFEVDSARHVVRLQRVVEMFQWVENCETKNDKKIYSYSRVWSEFDHHSDSFHDSNHHNPPRHPSIHSSITNNPDVVVGAYTLSSQLIDKCVNFEDCKLPHHLKDFLQPHAKIESARDADYYLFNGSLTDPKVGTLRVRYACVYDGGAVSLVAVQSGKTFRAFTHTDAHATLPTYISALACCGSSARAANHASNTASSGGSSSIAGGSNSGSRRSHYAIDDDSDLSFDVSNVSCTSGCCCCEPIFSLANTIAGGAIGTEIALLEERQTDAKTIFQDEANNFAFRLRLMRLLGCFLLSLGIYLIFNPISAVLSFIPYVESLLSNFFFFVAMILGFLWGNIIISTAWTMYHPEYLLGLLIILAALLYHAGDLLASYVCLGLSGLPLVILLLHAVEDWRYNAMLRRLDEATPLLTQQYNNNSSSSSGSGSSNNANKV